jgi:hypothetical protein
VSDNQAAVCPFVNVAVPADIMIDVRKYTPQILSMYLTHFMVPTV